MKGLHTNFLQAMAESRKAIRNACGIAVVATIEAMGYSIVPTMLIMMIAATLKKDDAQGEDTEN